MVYPAKSENARWIDRKDGAILLNQRNGRYYRLNGIAAWVWQHCDGTETMGQIASALSANHNISRYRVRRDVYSFIRCLKKRGFVKFSHI